MVTRKINVKGTDIAVVSRNEEDFISLTDMVKAFADGDQLIKNWLQNRNTIEFLSIWERINNPSFNLVEFHQIKTEIGLNRFVMSTKRWGKMTNAIGIFAKAGRYGGTFAHKDIAFEFGTWLSPEFKLFLIKEFQRLKDEENHRLNLDWQFKRTLTKINYRIHTDAVRKHLIPPKLNKKAKSFIYANEADVLSKALFGMIAKEWREVNPDRNGNIRDYAGTEQLVILANLESLNAHLIGTGLAQTERLETLNDIAITQMTALVKSPVLKKLK